MGQTVTINYEVDDLTNTSASPDWVDSFYLTASGVVNATSVLLGRVEQTAGVAGGSSYTGTLQVAIPPVAPGNYYVAMIADSQGSVPDTNRSNNTAASNNPIQVSVPTLPANGSTSGTIAAGQEMLYQLTLPAGQDVQITVNSSIAGAVSCTRRTRSRPPRRPTRPRRSTRHRPARRSA